MDWARRVSKFVNVCAVDIQGNRHVLSVQTTHARCTGNCREYPEQQCYSCENYFRRPHLRLYHHLIKLFNVMLPTRWIKQVLVPRGYVRFPWILIAVYVLSSRNLTFLAAKSTKCWAYVVNISNPQNTLLCGYDIESKFALTICFMAWIKACTLLPPQKSTK